MGRTRDSGVGPPVDGIGRVSNPKLRRSVILDAVKEPPGSLLADPAHGLVAGPSPVVLRFAPDLVGLVVDEDVPREAVELA